MKKWVCPVCGYVHEGDVPPAECPVCHVPGSKFVEQKADKVWAAEHVVGVGKQFGADVPEDVREQIIAGLRANFEGECTEVGMYLAMARVARPTASSSLQSSPSSTISTRSTTPSTRWPATKRDTVRLSRVC